MKNSSVLVAAALLISAAVSPVFGQDFQGKVTKENGRLIRPQEPALHFNLDVTSPAGTALPAKVSDDGFVLQTKRIDGGTSLDGWDPYKGLTDRRRLQPRASTFSGAAQSADPVAVDYNAIERAYAEAVPRPPAPLQTGVPVNHCAGSMIAASPWAMQAAAVNMLGANGTLMTQAGQPRVDVDNCRCEMAVPTTQCVQGRMQGFGTNVNSGPQVTMPGTGPHVMAPMMRGRTR